MPPSTGGISVSPSRSPNNKKGCPACQNATAINQGSDESAGRNSSAVKRIANFGRRSRWRLHPQRLTQKIFCGTAPGKLVSWGANEEFSSVCCDRPSGNGRLSRGSGDPRGNQLLSGRGTKAGQDFRNPAFGCPALTFRGCRDLNHAVPARLQ